MSTACVGRSRFLAVAVLALSVIAAPHAMGAARRRTWRLEGYVGQAPTGIKPVAHLVLQSSDKTYEFDLTRVSVSSGNASTTALVRDLQPHQNNLLLIGPAKTVEALTNASAGQKLLIIGYYRSRPSRQLQVMKISAVASDSAPPTK